MRDIYRGIYNTFKCNNFDEVIEHIKNGEVFRTDAMDWYYRVIPSEYDLPKDVFYMRRTCITSVTTKWRWFYKVERDGNGSKIYVGKDIEDKICDELKLWAREINPKTMCAFSGKRFVSYLNAIPPEIYAHEGFVDKMKKTFNNALIKRMKGLQEGQEMELERLFTISQTTKEIVDENLKRADLESAVKGQKASQEFEELKKKRIAEMQKER